MLRFTDRRGKQTVFSHRRGRQLRFIVIDCRSHFYRIKSKNFILNGAISIAIRYKFRGIYLQASHRVRVKPEVFIKVRPYLQL